MQYSKNIPRTYVGVVGYDDGAAIYFNNKLLGKLDQVDFIHDILAPANGSIVQLYMMKFPSDWNGVIPDHLGDVEVDDA